MVEIFDDRGAGKLLKLTAKGVFVEEKLSLKVGKGDFLGVVLADIAQDVLDAGMDFAVSGSMLGWCTVMQS